MDLKTLQQKSNVKLDHPSMNPIVAAKGKELVKRAHAAGIPICITQGFRSKAEQDALYAQGRTKPGAIVTNAPGGYSNHNFGLAIDFALFTPDGTKVVWDQKVDYDRDGKADWGEVVAIAKSLGFAWGGDWRGFPDAPHFEMMFGLTLAQVRAGVKPPTKVEAASKPVTSPHATEKPGTYTIKNGDTLSEISEQVKISVKDLKAWNKLKSDLIKPGQVLKLKKPAAAKPKPAPADETAIVPFPGTLSLNAKGMQTIDIERVQRAVKADVTGKFDKQTEKKVKEYQARKKLEVDGIVGRLTWNKLF